MVGPPLEPDWAANWAPPVAVPPGATPESAGTKPAAFVAMGVKFQENDQLV
jgi:hypothetical protein